MRPIRDARPGDAPALAAVHADAWAVGYAGQFPADVLAAEVEHRRTTWHVWTLEDSGRARRFYGRTGWLLTGAVREREFLGGVTRRLVQYARRLP